MMLCECRNTQGFLQRATNSRSIGAELSVDGLNLELTLEQTEIILTPCINFCENFDKKDKIN
jgi:hypothetical protein